MSQFADQDPRLWPSVQSLQRQGQLPVELRPPPVAMRFVDIVSIDGSNHQAEAALGGDFDGPTKTMRVANPNYVPYVGESNALAIQQGGDFFLVGGTNAKLPSITIKSDVNVGISPGTTAQRVQMNQVDPQPDPFDMVNLAAFNARITCAWAGWYRLSGGIMWDDSAITTGVLRTHDIRLNGTLTIVRATESFDVAGEVQGRPISRDYFLNVGNYVEMFAAQGGTASLAISAINDYSPFLQMTFLGP